MYLPNLKSLALPIQFMLSWGARIVAKSVIVVSVYKI